MALRALPSELEFFIYSASFLSTGTRHHCPHYSSVSIFLKIRFTRNVQTGFVSDVFSVPMDIVLNRTGLGLENLGLGSGSGFILWAWAFSSLDAYLVKLGSPFYFIRKKLWA
jgi:hypothetical protein